MNRRLVSLCLLTAVFTFGRSVEAQTDDTCTFVLDSDNTFTIFYYGQPRRSANQIILSDAGVITAVIENIQLVQIGQGARYHTGLRKVPVVWYDNDWINGFAQRTVELSFGDLTLPCELSRLAPTPYIAGEYCSSGGYPPCPDCVRFLLCSVIPEIYNEKPPPLATCKTRSTTYMDVRFELHKCVLPPVIENVPPIINLP